MAQLYKVHRIPPEVQYKVQRITGISANCSDVALDDRLVGGYIFTVKAKTTSDDAVTVTIKDSDGATLAGGSATSAATGGEWLTVEDRYPINDIPTYTVAGLGGGTLIIEITVAKQ
jgi:hypothetical protein